MSEATAFIEDTFWSKVSIGDSCECWEWTGTRNANGYGKVKILGKYIYAHRAAWAFVHFEIPVGFVVCHACDNRACCNPGHLMLGTSQSNAADMVRKGRQYTGPNHGCRGEGNCNAKLDEKSVRSIREAYEAGLYQREIAEMYGVAQSTVGNVVRRKTWRHVA